MGLEKTALKYALQNAVQFKGKANSGAVIGKIISDNPDAKMDMKAVALAAKKAVEEVNELPLSKQQKQLEEIAPELLEKKKHEKHGLKELPDAVEGKVVTRIPPEPSKYAHVGHAVSFMINYLYAEKYKGKCIVRFEDTNPEKAMQEYVDAITDDLQFLGIKSKPKFISDDMPAMIKAAEKLIKKRAAYVCFDNKDEMHEQRQKGTASKYRETSVEGNLEEWGRMVNGHYGEGEATLRFRDDMKSRNYAMRDPVLFRIVDAEHYRQKDRYRVWPLYDFANSFEDGTDGVTHILRSIEFGGMRIELQDKIKELLGLPKQTVVQYGRFNITDAITQGREIRELIAKKEVAGWDDPRLVTIKALRRRGIQPKTFSDLAVEVGLSTTPTNIDWSVISSINRKYLDASSKRYFFVENPKEITIKGAPRKKVSLTSHPDDKKPSRHFTATGRFLIAEKDYYDIRNLKDNEVVRLMDCLNFRKDFSYDSDGIETYRSRGGKIIHWLTSDNIDSEVLMPHAEVVKGKAETSASSIKVGEIVQFSRFGFCRLEKKTQGRLEFIYCHK